MSDHLCEMTLTLANTKTTKTNFQPTKYNQQYTQQRLVCCRPAAGLQLLHTEWLNRADKSGFQIQGVEGFQYILRRKYVLVIFCNHKMLTQWAEFCFYDSIHLSQYAYHVILLFLLKVFFT